MTEEVKTTEEVQDEEIISHDDFWSEQYEEATSGQTQFLFFKNDTTRFRPVGLTLNRYNWFRQVISDYQGTKSFKYLVMGFEVLPAESSDKPKATVAVFSKGAWGQISQSQKLGYDFFTNKGTALIVMRQTTGQRVTYNVMPAPTPTVPIPEHVLEELNEFNWDNIVEAYNKMQEGRNSGSSSSQSTSNEASIADQIVNNENAPW